MAHSNTIRSPRITDSKEHALAELDVQAALQRACEQIAPTWPLDRFIAVNPFWGMVDSPLPEVSARLTALAGSRLLMPRAYYRQAWLAGRFSDEHLRQAIMQSGSDMTLPELHSLMLSDEPALPRRARVMDVVDSTRDLVHQISMRDFITHDTSQFCAAYFDEAQAQLGPDRSDGLYASWVRHMRASKSARLLTGMPGIRRAAGELLETPLAMAAVGLSDLDLRACEHDDYLLGLLLDLNGWAAWCAYLRWAARLEGREDTHLTELLAIRLGWEWLLLRAAGPALRPRWQRAMESGHAAVAQARLAQADDWLLQRALEIAWQEEICRALPAGLERPAKPRAHVQAVFCIDVRSEVFRRALEAQSEAVQTLGFAGFFGLPIEYRPFGSEFARPQLPGLLQPKLRAVDTGMPGELATQRRRRIDLDAAWSSWKTGAVSAFAFVDAMGLGYAAKLIADCFGRGERPVADAAGLSERERAGRKPRLVALATGEPLTLAARVDVAASVLRAMSLTRGFARLVLLAGHGSETRNNAHAAGLDCGACCGQTGEINARAAAALLNDPEVRAGLAERGVTVPADTHFVAGLHNTTTDDLELFDEDDVPREHAAALSQLRDWLAGAGARARSERAHRLGIEASDASALHAAVRQRAHDWSQPRPEWGLADNCALIVAPREHCEHLDLGGRAFLHEYRHEQDEGYAVLELIMTAPMIVTHWINMQYYASTVDNGRYGSGNKVLHNVVGRHIGVFEGNGGDLRIGLSLQSLHDGARFVHTPRRLAVFIEAPREAIDTIANKHAIVRALRDNEWIQLFQFDAAHGIHAYRGGRWVCADVQAR